MEILLNELDKIQEKYGYISENEIEKMALEKDIRKAELYGIISFYSRFYTEKKGKYKLKICKSIVCGLNKSIDILKAVEEELGIKTGETTKDMLFSLETVECLGHCGEAPVMAVNDKIYDNLDIVKLKKILTLLKEGEI